MEKKKKPTEKNILIYLLGCTFAVTVLIAVPGVLASKNLNNVFKK